MAEKIFDKEMLKNEILENIKHLTRKTIEHAHIDEIYNAIAYTVREEIMDRWIKTHQEYQTRNVKHLYYMSMEFLLGRALGNNLINLTLMDEIKEILDELKVDYNVIEEQERDAGLGNGGLGRLAACFMDSLATLEYPAYGCGIRYKYGIFEQKIEDGYQVEYPDMWLEKGNPWEVKRPEYEVEVRYGGNVRVVQDEVGKCRYIHENYDIVKAIPYDIPIIGYDSYIINTLRLWDAEPVHELNLRSFEEGLYQEAVSERDMAEMIVEVLYPNDNHNKGKELRVKQQYFFVSATLQEAIRKYKESNHDLMHLKEKVVFQLNDTHPAVAILELMRILMDLEGLEWNDAWNITKSVCAYTNHTILSEALEKWPVDLFSRLLPRIYQIIEEINRRFCVELVEEHKKSQQEIRKMAIISDGQVKMAHLAIVGSFSVNGVAELHSEILKKQELKDFYEIYPEKFNNKTNGITQRRWLLKSNPELSELIKAKIGDGWIKDLSILKQLENFIDDKKFREKFMDIKFDNKVKLADYIKKNLNIEVNPSSIFDVQVKRLHEYKRQLLNVLHILYLYNKVRMHPNIDITPRTFIFAAKAAPGYHRAKLIIKLINDIAIMINNDETIKGKIKVVFLENYSVSLAEKIFPASDVSEQISTAGKEASGTGNMKFMLNGAVTIGTLDGANIEIKEEVGDENIFIFGLAADEVVDLRNSNTYDPWFLYNTNQELRMVLTRLVDGSINKNVDLYKDIYEALLNGNCSHADEYFVLKDFESYVEAQGKIAEVYKNKEHWARMAILNVARSGKFSSDRTIEEYAKEIWQLEKVEIV
ncbi:MAG TPA: glycogen phosphorylase [Clostridiales bacterium]|nr:MAG: glycogen phosphorylase [Clostridiales bacterium GWD2_32_19]HCC07738.1 glycogen phosphorylase [Clostridiales bacterium]